MSHHVAVGVVDAEIAVFSGFKTFDQFICYLGALHPRALFKGDYIGGNFNICLKLVRELSGAVAVPEIGHMTVLLSFGYGKLGYSGTGKVFAECIGYFGRIHKVFFRDVQVAVVFKHSGIDYLREAHAVELIERAFRSVKCAGDLNGAVATEVEENYAVAVLDRTDGSAVLGNDEGRKILVDHVVLVAVGLYRLGGGGELTSFAKHMGVPAALDHRPVSLVTVHCDLHSSAAAGDLYIEIGSAKSGNEILKGVDVFKSGGLADVSAVKQDVQTHAAHALGFGFAYHCFQVVDVGVYVAVGEQAEEVKRSAACFYIGNKLLPCGGGKHFSAFYRLGNELCALSEDLTCAESVMTNLTVAHVVIRGQTDCGSVSLQRDHRAGGHKSVKCGGKGAADCICGSGGSKSHAVHDYCKYRSGDAFKIFKPFELFFVFHQ